MNELTIITNHHKRDLLSWFELSENQQDFVRSEHDWLFEDESYLDMSYIVYKDWIYTLNDFMRIENHSNKKFSEWHGYLSDTFFSGVLIKFTEDDFDQKVIMGMYYS